MTTRSIGRLLLLLALFPPTAWGWDPKDHRMIVALAIEHSPPGLASFLRDNLDAVVQGSADPDRKFMDTANHTYHVDDGTRSNPDHVAYLSGMLVSMVRNGAPREKVAYWFGALSHYVSDIDQPLHTSEKDKRENWYHLLFEGLGYGIERHARVLGFRIDVKIGKALSGWQFPYDGRHDPIEDVRAWQIENARWAYRFYDEIRRIYTEKGPFDEGERLAEIFRTCIGEAADDVIDLWAHVYRSLDAELAALPLQSHVLLIDVDKKGRMYRGGKRLTEEGLVEAVRRHVAAPALAGNSALLSAYVEIDDRCAPSVGERLEEICAASGITRFSSIFVTKGPWTSRLYRAVKVHAASLAASRDRTEER